MYTKRALVRRVYSTLKCSSSSQGFIRLLNTAVERLAFANPNGYQTENPSPRNDITKHPSGNYGEATQSVNLYNNNTWQSSWHLGKSPDYNIDDKVKDFDKFCSIENLKMALSTMEKLEKMGHVLDLASLLRLAKLCGEEKVNQEASELQEAKVVVYRKISALIQYLDVNHVKYYIDAVIAEFDAFCEQGKVRQALHSVDTLGSMSYVVDLGWLLRLGKLCGEAGALEEAKAVHGRISGLVRRLDVSSYHVLMEMYSNCGLVDEALSVLEGMTERNLESWCIMMRCFANNGGGEDAIDLFTRFKNEGNKPDGQIFRCVFHACGVLGDVDEGLLHFESMLNDYGIVPSMEHYVSVVEMFVLPGFLEEALEFVEKMPVEPNADVWETLMNLSRVHGDLKLGDRCAEIVDELDPTRLTKSSREGFLLVKKSDVVKETLKKKLKGPGSSRSTNKMEYKAGDTNLPEHDELFVLIKNLKKHMVEMGYVAFTKMALHDIDEESKEAALLGHSERIAFARAVLNSPPRTTFTVMKNLRVCVDCHNALKIMAVIVGREMIMRDAKRFHHFKKGDCRLLVIKDTPLEETLMGWRNLKQQRQLVCHVP